MTVPQVWVSSTTPEIQFDCESPGAAWEHVGEINTTEEVEFRKHIQQMLGIIDLAPGTAEFYLSGKPDSLWVQATDRKPFWLAIDPYGSMRSIIRGAKPTFFVSTDKATVGQMTRRAPENHPGDMVKWVKVPIRLKRTDTGFLTCWTLPTT